MNKWKQRLMIIALFLIVSLAACTPPAAPAGDEPVYQTAEPTDAAAKEDTTATAAPAAEGKAETMLEGAVMVYERAGGLKSIGPTEWSWSFYADGRIVGSDGREWQVPPEEIEKLVNDVMTLGFAEFETSYIPEDTCCDRVTHTLTVRDGDQVYTTTVLDGADAPEELFQAAGLVNTYLMALPTE
ncbi:MAG TPA: hypothetical protein PLD25_26015 [Chloroflexota bacterium]|nr:hypothetical protein [Chloroflexota bacterium]HUM72058.1 hypothetical protein [Chloroflexota bacterium]